MVEYQENGDLAIINEYKFRRGKNTQQQNTVKLTGVKSVTMAETENVYNMEVDDNHNFAINGGLIVHNCMDATRYFVHTMKVVRRGEKRMMR